MIELVFPLYAESFFMKRSEIILMILQVPVDFVLLLFAGATAYASRFLPAVVAVRPVVFRLSLDQFLHVVGLVALLWLILFVFVGLYSVDPNRKLGNDIGRIFWACSTGLAIVALYVLFTQQQFDSRFLIATAWAFAIVYITLGRIFMRGVKGLMYRAGVGLRRVVIIGNGPVTDSIVNTLGKRKELGYNVVEVFAHFNIRTEKKIIGYNIDEVIFTNPRAHQDEMFSAITFCNIHHKTFKYSADLFATLSTNMTVSPLGGIPIVELRRTRLDAWGRVFKRIFDLVAGLFFAILTSPIMLVTACAILIETGYPIIYKNERVGIRGKYFFTLKFRSMYKKDCTGLQFGIAGKKAENKEVDLIKKQNARSGPIYKVAHDPRVTKVGHFIRRWSIDELPQFFNVIAGSMSIVGPRPHQPREVEHYKSQYPNVFTLKPGITGSAQISGRSDLSFEQEMRLDILYIEKWSPFLDIIIVIKTPFVLLKKRSVE